jgi:hypothetical protein
MQAITPEGCESCKSYLAAPLLVVEMKLHTIFSGCSSERSLLGAADELAELKAKSRGQSIRDFNPHAHLPQFNRADISAVHIGKLGEFLLGEPTPLSLQAD